MRIAALFKIEVEINGHEPEAALRRSPGTLAPAARPSWRAASATALASISRKSALAGAIRYSLARWPALSRFAHHGRLEMTNNAAERAIRPMAVHESFCHSFLSV